MKRPKEEDYFEYRGRRLIMDHGRAENYIDALEEYIDYLEKQVGASLSLPDNNSMRQIAQHVRNSEESRDPLIYEQGILRGMQIMKNIVSSS